jgi:hypothetical protein
LEKIILFFSDIDEDDSENEDNYHKESEDEEENPLDMDILDVSTKSAKAKTVADVWFEQDIFKQTLEDDNDDEEFELDRKLSALKSDGISVLGKNLIQIRNKLSFLSAKLIDL